MRILTIIITPGHSGGAENAALFLSKELQKTIKVDIASMSDKMGEGIKKIPKLKLSFLKSFTNFLVLPLPSINLRSYDVVHIHNTHPAIAVFLFALYCKLAGIPYTITTHGFVEVSTIPQRYEFRGSLKRLVYRLLVRQPLSYSLKNAGSVAALCKFEDKYLTKLYGVKKEKIYHIYNGYNPKWEEYFNLDKTKIKKVRKKFNLVENKQIILFVGNIKLNKGVDLLLKSSKYLKNMDYKIVIVGKPIFDSYYNLLKKLTQKNKIKDKVVFTGFVSDEELAILYQLSSVLVLPTRADTLPLVVLDAMFFKKPVVASRVGGIPEEVVDGKTGFLVPAGKPKQLAEAISRLLKDESLAEKMGQAGYRRAKNQFTWSKVAQKTIKIYRKTLRNAKGK